MQKTSVDKTLEHILCMNLCEQEHLYVFAMGNTLGEIFFAGNALGIPHSYITILRITGILPERFAESDDFPLSGIFRSNPNQTEMSL